jgi:hypothetical protein
MEIVMGFGGMEFVVREGRYREMEIVKSFGGMGFVVRVRRCGENGNCNGLWGNGICGACETVRRNENDIKIFV